MPLVGSTLFAPSSPNQVHLRASDDGAGDRHEMKRETHQTYTGYAPIRPACPTDRHVTDVPGALKQLSEPGYHDARKHHEQPYHTVRGHEPKCDDGCHREHAEHDRRASLSRSIEPPVIQRNQPGATERSTEDSRRADLRRRVHRTDRDYSDIR